MIAITNDEVETLISSALCKSCQLDPAPTWLVKELRTLLSPFISLLFSKSLASGCYPSLFKEAVVRTLLKKHGLDTGEMKNYRPFRFCLSCWRESPRLDFSTFSTATA